MAKNRRRRLWMAPCANLWHFQDTVQCSCLSYISILCFEKKSLPPGSSSSYKLSFESLELLEFECCKKIILSTYVVFPETGLSSFICKQYFITFDPSELRMFLDLPMMAACFFKSVSDNEEPSLKNFIFFAASVR